MDRQNQARKTRTRLALKARYEYHAICMEASTGASGQCRSYENEHRKRHMTKSVETEPLEGIQHVHMLGSPANSGYV